MNFLTILSLFIVDMFKRFFRFGTLSLQSVVLMSSFVALLVVCFAHFPFHVARLAGPMIVLVAFLEISLLRGRERIEELTI